MAKKTELVLEDDIQNLDIIEMEPEEKSASKIGLAIAGAGIALAGAAIYKTGKWIWKKAKPKIQKAAASVANKLDDKTLEAVNDQFDDDDDDDGFGNIPGLEDDPENNPED